MFRAELQHPLRYATARARPHLPVRRRARLRRSEIVHLPARHDPGLPGDAYATRLRVREPELIEVLRLRHFVLGLMVWRGRPFDFAQGRLSPAMSLPRRRRSGVASPRKKVSARSKRIYGDGIQHEFFSDYAGRGYGYVLVLRHHADVRFLQRLC